MAPTALMDGHLVVVRHSESLAQGGLAKCSGQCSWDNRLLRRLRAHVKYNQTYARRWKLQSCFPTRATYWCAARGGAGALTSRTTYHGCAPVDRPRYQHAPIPIRALTPPSHLFQRIDALMPRTTGGSAYHWEVDHRREGSLPPGHRGAR